jgi:hypothetical protein
MQNHDTAMCIVLTVRHEATATVTFDPHQEVHSFQNRSTFIARLFPLPLTKPEYKCETKISLGSGLVFRLLLAKFTG